MQFKDLNHAMLTVTLNNNLTGGPRVLEALDFMHELSNKTNKAQLQEPTDSVMSLVKLLIEIKVQIDRWSAITLAFVMHPSLVEKLKDHDKVHVDDNGTVFIWGARVIPCTSIMEEHVFGFTEIDDIPDAKRVAEGFYADVMPETTYKETASLMAKVHKKVFEQLEKEAEAIVDGVKNGSA